MASSLICFMVNRGGKGGSSDRFHFLGSKIIADGDCSHETRRRLLLGRKAMTNLDCVEKQRHYSANQVCIVKAMVFPVATYCCGEGSGTPLQYSCLENPMDRGAW